MTLAELGSNRSERGANEKGISKMRVRGLLTIVAISIAASVFAAGATPSGENVTLRVNWDKVDRVSETVPTTQHLASAYTLRTHPLNKALLRALKKLHTNDTRLQLWFTIPNQVVAELREPTAAETHWDFRYMDPVVLDFFAHTSGARHVNIGTIPRWMYKVPPIELPGDPGATFPQYIRGTKGDLLKDPSGKQYADYQVRIYQWYTQGGFVDEIGKVHKSGYHLKIDYWGILNEPNSEDKLSVEQYTRIYDTVSEAIHKIDPNVHFVGPEVAGDEIAWGKYFLNPKNHGSNAPPLQFFSVHNYVVSNNDPATWQISFFTNPQRTGPGSAVLPFVDQLRELMKLRDDLSPTTKIVIDELGTANLIKPTDGFSPNVAYEKFNSLYWVASGGNWAANFITAERLGIPMISMSQMLGYPLQSPSCTMVNPETANPNAHYWILYLVNSNFGPGDKLVPTQSSSVDVIAQASLTARGRKLLLVNTSDRTVRVDLADAFQQHAVATVVDETSGERPPRKVLVQSPSIELAPFAVTVVSKRNR